MAGVDGLHELPVDVARLLIVAILLAREREKGGLNRWLHGTERRAPTMFWKQIRIMGGPKFVNY